MARGLVIRQKPVTRSGVWLAWVAANVVPSLVVSALVVALRGALGINRTVIVAYVALFGLVAALQAWVRAQWLASRPATVARRPSHWATATVVALVVAMFFGVGIVATLDGLGHEHLGLIAGWAVAGAVLGVVQAPRLGASGRGGWWWVVATTASWVVAAAAYSRLTAAGAGLARFTLVRWLVGGLSLEGNIELGITAVTFALYGVLTGLVLAGLTPGRVVVAR